MKRSRYSSTVKYSDRVHDMAVVDMSSFEKFMPAEYVYRLLLVFQPTPAMRTPSPWFAMVAK